MIKYFFKKHLKEVATIEYDNFNNPWSLKQFEKYFMKSSKSMSYIYKGSEKVIGYLMAKVILDEIHLHNIAVSQKYQNNKIGFHLMNHLISEGNLKDKKKICLEVNENNIFALRLYISLGFIEVGVREKYYVNNEGAILMDYNF